MRERYGTGYLLENLLRDQRKLVYGRHENKALYGRQSRLQERRVRLAASSTGALLGDAGSENTACSFESNGSAGVLCETRVGRRRRLQFYRQHGSADE